MMTRILLLALVLGTIGLQAQNRANFPWWNSPVAQDLHLTEAQSQKIRQIVRSYRDKLFDARNASQKAQADLEDLLNDPNFSQEQARPVIDRVASTRANATRVFLEMSVQLRAVLNMDQWRILVRRWDEVQRKRPADTQVPPE
jgi:Spy/CpxP family protein refolding chaperone